MLREEGGAPVVIAIRAGLDRPEDPWKVAKRDGNSRVFEDHRWPLHFFASLSG